jgi:DNA (cytosine-5)-methyltransferase 1
MVATRNYINGGPIVTDRNTLPGQGLKVLSFFTGCGGLDLGFEQAGFETIYATDIDEDSCNTLRMNLGHHFNSDMVIERADIVQLDPRTLPTQIDLVIGGPPCQSFSASGRRAGGAAGRLDQRGRLFEAYCRIIDHVKPKAFLFENVRGILATNKGEDWKAIKEAFGEIGYSISYRVLDALDYGAPQQRERMFLVGHKLDRDFLFPEPTYGPDSVSRRPHKTAGDALAHIQEDEDLSSLKLDGGKYSHLLPLVPPGQNYLFFTEKRGYPKPIFAYRSRFSDFLYKANPDAPVKTIIASPGKYTGPLHWENRYFSVREYMRLQGFPDTFKLSGERADKIRQIGNSVSPHIAYPMAIAIAKQIFGVNVPIELLEASRVLSYDKRKGAKAQSTRALHAAVSESASDIEFGAFFTPSNYSATERTVGVHALSSKVRSTVRDQAVSIRVETDSTSDLFAKMILLIRQSSKDVNSHIKLEVSAYGRSPGTAQAMWNAVDEWVRKSSNFHSLFELYGHFTEPHPLFSIAEFHAYSNHPIALFAEHAANFKNCSQYYPKQHLVQLFSSALGTSNFLDISNYLRQYRFDIRSKETNIAIGADDYMVAYPFNLPARRQMNFKVKELQHVEASLEVRVSA